MKQKNLTLSLSMILFLALIILAGCGKGKKEVRNENIATPGRDKELYGQASEKLRKGRYDESRLLFNVIVSTYPDSEYLSLSKLAIADSFYLEGGSSNLEQAVSQYRDFVQYFPTHPKVCDCYLKMAEAYMRQMGAYNRDMTKARQAYGQLNAAKQKCTNSPVMDQVIANQNQVKEILVLHEIDVAETYIKRSAWKSVELRSREVVEKYGKSNFRDLALYYLGISLIEQEQPEEASVYFTEIARDTPNSEFASDAKEFLGKLGKPIPTPTNNDPAPLRPGRIEKVRLIFGMNNLVFGKSGVMIDRKGKIDKAEEQKAVTPQTDPNDIKAVRSLSSRPRTNEATTEEVPKPQTPASVDNGTPAPVKTAAKPEAKIEPKPEKKKKGLLGIFK